ncbi:hypothetical protein G4Z05_06030 [Bacillus thermocopriae]|uniref:Uncharacterized protein n=1 Tax=Neobacillus thermocopriae TaxID=1215031 RepID=A0A6B3TNL2_9BACI|nr:hypothetical protein [Neobacillus thermocopriae]MED3622732.1 hypothetical protein [Neobacillus thermocopriae]MED3714168.1 hypothetical protein [Neobacillus thermocopriae]NEX78453.1 hypothetical protein [Neobacillus thermocopriae]
MKKNRYLMCLLLSGLMLYYAVPRLHVAFEGEQGIFAISWLAFALMVIAGNLTGILYSPKKQVQKPQPRRVKKRSFH